MSIKEIETKMSIGMNQLKGSMDLSIEYLKENPSDKKMMNALWENFLFDFVDYIKQQERATGQELIKGIPISKLIKLL